MNSTPPDHPSRQSAGPLWAHDAQAADESTQILTAFADLFSLMPDAKPGDVDTVVANVREDLQGLRLPEASLDDIKLYTDTPAAPPIRKSASPAARPERLVMPADEALAPRPVKFVAPATRPAPDPIREPAVIRQPPVAPLLANFENRDDERAAEPTTSVRSQNRNDRNRIKRNRSDESADEPDPPSLSEQIMEHLEKSNIAAVSRLRIEVKNGDVIVSGEVPSSHERHLVSHYCKQHPDVTNFVDKMVVMCKKKGAKESKSAPEQPAVQKGFPKPYSVPEQ